MSRLLDLLKGILSLAVILLLLIGVPLALLAMVGFPLPTEWVPVSTIRRHLADGDIPGPFVVKLLAVVVWVVWVQLAVAVLVEAFSLLRGRVSGRVPVFPGLQSLAGSLVASTLLIIAAFTPNRAAAGVAPIVPIEQLDPAAQSGGGGGPGPARYDVVRSDAGLMIDNELSAEWESGGPTTAGPARAPAPKAVGQYAAKQGDNWWDMAERLLGDGMRWSELRDLNTGKTMLSGEVICSQTEIVRPGWRLDVPADADTELLDAAVAIDQIAEPELRVAAKPDMLVYEGRTEAVDPGPGVPYQVAEGDNLWDIAERHLGDPFRWPEIFERSYDLQQPFGRQITDPNLIWPDSILWLPTDAIDVPAADLELVSEVVGALNPEPSSQDKQSVPEDPEPPVVISPQDLRRATAAADVAAGAIPGSASDPEPPPQPEHGIEQEPVHGTDPEDEPPNLPVGVEPERLSPAPMPDPDPGPGGPGHDSQPETNGGVPAPVTAVFGAGGLLVASGLLGLLRRSRRLRLSEAGERSQPEQPPFELAEMETVLRNCADSNLASSVHRAISSLATRPIAVGEPLAAPEVIRVFSDRVEVVQHRHDPDLPPPWVGLDGPLPETIGDRTVARLPVESLPAPASDAAIGGRGDGSVAPMCVTVGRGLMINLEPLGVVSIVGTPQASAGLVRSMVHELATGPSRRSVSIRVSDWLPGADLHTQVRCGPLDDLHREFADWLEAVDLGLAGSGGFSAYAMRAAGLADSVPGAIVVFADAADAPLLQPLVTRAAEHAMPLSLVFSGDLSNTEIEPAAVLRIEGDITRLDPYGFTATTQHLDQDVLIGAEALLHHARQAPMVLRPEDGLEMAASEFETDEANVATQETPERDIVTERASGAEPEITDQATDGDGGILIKILGPMEVTGGPEGLTEEELSVLAFLALVGPSTGDQIKEAVWPAGPANDVRFDSIVEKLRRELQHRFPDAGDGRYRVRSVITDLGSARRWVTQAGSMSGDRARNMLQLALSDVRGEPFAGVTERWWQWAADHKMAIATQASTLLMDACFDLCDSAYGANDVHLAKWACDVGALIDPIHETVAVRRVQLMQILGLTDEAESVVEQWEALYTEIAERPPPRGPRVALGTVATGRATIAAPNVG